MTNKTDNTILYLFSTLQSTIINSASFYSHNDSTERLWLSQLEQCSAQGRRSNPSLASWLSYVPRSSLNLYQPCGKCVLWVKGWKRENVKLILPLAPISFTPGFSPDLAHQTLCLCASLLATLETWLFPVHYLLTLLIFLGNLIYSQGFNHPF